MRSCNKKAWGELRADDDDGDDDGDGPCGGDDDDDDGGWYFYHPDHLGSTSYITDASGEVNQHIEYFAFGELFVEEGEDDDVFGDDDGASPRYLFNAKELDEETGLYYYGARYYDGKTSVWLSVDPLAEKYPGQSPFSYAGNNPVLFVDYDGNDYGVNVNGGTRTITVSAHFLTSGANARAFNTHGRDKWNAQSGRYVFIAGGVKALKQGQAQAYRININITSEVRNGENTINGNTVEKPTPRDDAASADRTGTVNSFDTVSKFPMNDRQGGGTSDNQVDVKADQANSGTTTHETSHAMGNAHTSEGGALDVYGGTSVGKSNIEETLKGVGIGGDTSQRNAGSSVGDGTLLNGSTNQGLEQGKVISQRRYDRIVRRMERRANED